MRYIAHNLDIDFFQTVNPNNSYWAGFIAADGHLKNKRGISIELNIRDKSHLIKLRKQLKFDGTETTRNRLDKRTHKQYQSATLLVNGDKGKLNRDLLQNFNIYEGSKSLTLCPPLLNNESDIRSFIRGYMDGDGSIGIYRNYPRLSFVGTQMFLIWIKSQIQKFVPNIGNPSLMKRKLIYDLAFDGLQSKFILDWIYQESINDNRLERKYNIYLQIQKDFINGCSKQIMDRIGSFSTYAIQ